MDKKAAGGKKGATGTSVERKPRSVSKDETANHNKGTSKSPAGKKGGAAVGSKAVDAGKSSKGRERSKSHGDKKKGAASTTRGKSSASGKGNQASGKKAGKAGQTSRSKSSSKEETKAGAKKVGGKKSEDAKKEEPEEEEEEYKGMKPPRPAQPYILFNTAMTRKLKEEEGIGHKEAFSKAAGMWKTVSEEEKKPYFEEHAKHQKVYEDQLKMIKDKGYFLLEDGTKSSDYPAPDKATRKQKAKSGEDSKVGKKRSSSAHAASGKKEPASGKKGTAKKNTKKSSEDDLDVEASEESLEASD